MTTLPPAISVSDAVERRPRRTLSRDLVVSIVLVVTGVLAVVGGLTYVYTSFKANERQSEALEVISDHLNHSLELPVWTMDEVMIKKIGNSFFQNILVANLVVTDPAGQVLFEMRREGHDPASRKRAAIVHGDALVGYLEVVLSAQSFREKQRRIMWLSVIFLASVIVVLVVALQLVINRSLISPLNRLIQCTEQISRGDYAAVHLQAPQEEIRTILSRFVFMAQRVERRVRALKAANQRLAEEIVENRDAQSAELSSKQELDSIIRSTPDVIFRLDTLGRFTFVSDAIRRYCVTPGELLGKPLLDYIHQQDRAVLRKWIGERGGSGPRGRRVAIHGFGDYIRRDSTSRQELERDPLFLVDTEALYVCGESDLKVFVGTQGIARDITEQQRMESARMESEDRLRLTLDVSAAGIWQLDFKTGAFHADQRIYDLLGYSASDLAEGLTSFREKIAEGTWDAIQRKFKRHLAGEAAMFDHEFTLQSSQGQWKWFYTKAKVVRFQKNGRPKIMVGIIIDTSERKESEAERERLEMKLQQARKMEAIGTLAGGIAHDFNNILGAIFGNAELAQMQSADNPRIQGYVDNIFKASERAKGLVEQILTFTRQGKSQKVACDIAPVLKEVVKLLRASLSATIEIVQTIPSNLGAVMADQTQIHQVMMNLCTNAAHAMEPHGGRLTVLLEARSVEAGAAANPDDLAPGRYLQLSVSDTGRGMDQDVVERIFEPYFTTKAVGKGTGMGLATVHGIVTSHDGRVFVESVPGQGSVFRVLFPVLESPVAITAAQFVAYPRGSERILFVDDEEALVRVGVETLTNLGYDAVGTQSPLQALETFQARPDSFDLVITDMTMPALTGDQLAVRIARVRPATPIIICTGFSRQMSPERASELGIRAFLMKPVTAQDLGRTIREVLDGPQAPGPG